MPLRNSDVSSLANKTSVFMFLNPVRHINKFSNSKVIMLPPSLSLPIYFSSFENPLGCHRYFSNNGKLFLLAHPFMLMALWREFYSNAKITKWRVWVFLGGRNWGFLCKLERWWGSNVCRKGWTHAPDRF